MVVLVTCKNEKNQENEEARETTPMGKQPGHGQNLAMAKRFRPWENFSFM